MHRLVERAQSMGGTCTGEHGIGQGKQKYLVGELGPEAIEAMAAIKRALDPHNIFNPGKIIPPV
jgi:D-lactate dehydrogenase (cytochrome)